MPVVEGLWDRGNLGALCRLCDGAIHMLISSLNLAERVHSWGAYSFAVHELRAGHWRAAQHQYAVQPPHSVLLRAGEHSMFHLHTSARTSIFMLENQSILSLNESQHSAWPYSAPGYFKKHAQE